VLPWAPSGNSALNRSTRYTKVSNETEPTHRFHVTMRWTPHHQPVSAGTGRVHRNFTNMGRGKDEHLDYRY
jgi:hypothetical protein